MSTLTKPTRFLTDVAERVKPELSRGTDVWTFFNPLVFPSAVNLGQGYMNWKPPAFILDPLLQEMEHRTELHHYSHARGRPRLREAIREHYSESYCKPKDTEAVQQGTVRLDDHGLPVRRPVSNIPLDIEKEMVVTAGANEGMYAAMCAFIDEGDEVVMFEPFFDQYVCEVSYNGGVPVYIPMIPGTSGGAHVDANDWSFDWDLLEEKLQSPRVKALFLNTPYNPIGKVCTLAELQRLAQLCIKYDILVISDEVYDCLTYDGHQHIRIASIDGMWDRTLTIGSAGKSFACTGWRVGWVIGAPHLVGPTAAAHVRITFTANSPASEGAAIGLELEPKQDFFRKQREEYAARRQELMDALDNLGLPYTVPHGSYFVLVDASSIHVPEDFPFPDAVLKKARDYQICWFIAKTCDVVVLPVTAFYSDEHAHAGDRYIRFTFCKDNQIGEAARRLEKDTSRLRSSSRTPHDDLVAMADDAVGVPQRSLSRSNSRAAAAVPQETSRKRSTARDVRDADKLKEREARRERRREARNEERKAMRRGEEKAERKHVSRHPDAPVRRVKRPEPEERPLRRKAPPVESKYMGIPTVTSPEPSAPLRDNASKRSLFGLGGRSLLRRRNDSSMSSMTDAERIKDMYAQNPDMENSLRSQAKAKQREVQSKLDAEEQAMREKLEAKERAMREKQMAKSTLEMEKAESKLRAAQVKADAKNSTEKAKREAKQQAMIVAEKKREAAEILRQQKLDEKARKQQEKNVAREAVQRDQEAKETAAIAQAREQERLRERAEMDRKQRRLLAITPFRRRQRAVDVELEPEQRHELLKALVMMQINQEFLDFGRPNILTMYGYPFASDSSEIQRKRRLQLQVFAKKKQPSAAMSKDMLDALHEPLILRHMYQVHLRTFPWLNKAPLSFWRKRIQRLNDDYTHLGLSTSRERGEMVLTHMLSLGFTQFLGMFFSRGFGVRGANELRGPGMGDPGTEEWGVGKNWGAGTVKRGLDRPYQLNARDTKLIDSFFVGQEREAWVAAGRDVTRIDRDWDAFKETIIEREDGMEELLGYLPISNVNNLPVHLQNTEEFVRVQVALIARWLLYESPSADDLFRFVRVIHSLFPYWPARQILKVANAQVMIQMFLSLLLASPAGSKSLFQRIVGFVLSKQVNVVQREFIDPIQREINEPALMQKVDAYVRNRSVHDADRMEQLSIDSGDDILTVILNAYGDLRLDGEMQNHVLDMQRAFACSPYQADPGLAYPPGSTPGKDKPAVPTWGATVPDAARARMFALLKLYLRERLRKRDYEKFVELLSTSIVPDIIRDGAQIIFYDIIREVASVADLSARLGDMQNLIDDMIRVRTKTDNSAEQWVDLAHKHHEFIYFFVHEMAPVLDPLWKWCQTGCDFMSLSTTDPANPADRNAENIEVNLDEMLLDERLSENDVDGIIAEADAMVEYARWRKIRFAVQLRSIYLLGIQPSVSGVWKETIPTESMRKSLRSVDNMMMGLLQTDKMEYDDGYLDKIRGSERRDLPWAFYDKANPLGQSVPAEKESDEFRMPANKAEIKPPSLDYTRKLLPMFRELLVAKMPDWLDPEVNSEPIAHPTTLVNDSTKMLKTQRFGIFRRG
ncbi:hypothetical protein MVES_000584 [Malassezia vespertilionis]|uniref:Aminotransferase class I/classII domain-containing protein n=1 Tax=Malassezia vespertilionis TaxID=2020962 RepID=A0A2N1JG11_9BASI|nr:hypothetical protein MVES_000584 [Malassezia vespertilionis]